jgi:hypothetical protein
MEKQEKEESVTTPRPLPTVDVTQLIERLRLTPEERLRVAVDSANNLRRFLETVRSRP